MQIATAATATGTVHSDQLTGEVVLDGSQSRTTAKLHLNRCHLTSEVI